MLGAGLPGCPALPHPWPCGETTSAQSPSRQSHPASAARPRKSEERGSGVLLQSQCSCPHVPVLHQGSKAGAWGGRGGGAGTCCPYQPGRRHRTRQLH